MICFHIICASLGTDPIALLVFTFIRPGTRSLLTAGIVPYLLLQHHIQALT